MRAERRGLHCLEPSEVLLAELTSLKEQHAADHSQLQLKLNSIEDTLQLLIAWTCTQQQAGMGMALPMRPIPGSASAAPLAPAAVPAGPPPHLVAVWQPDAREVSFSGALPEALARLQDLQVRAAKGAAPAAAAAPAAFAAEASPQPGPVSLAKYERYNIQPEHTRLDMEGAHLLGGHKAEILFSDGATAKDQEGQAQRGGWTWFLRQLLWDGLLMPYEKNVWDMFIMVLLLWVCFGTPVVICFGLASDPWRGDPLGIVQFIVDVMFLLDMYLSFRTAYIDKRGQLVVSRRRIARAYLSKWFLPDLISVLPLHFFLGSWSELTTMFKLLRVIRFQKMMRLLKAYRSQQGLRLPRLIEYFDMRLDKSLLNIFIAIFTICVSLHLSACIFYYMALLKGLGPGTWVAKYGMFDASSSLWTKYLNSLYWSATTITTVGYGDITPASWNEKLLAIPLMILGVNMLGYITSSIDHIVQIRNASQKQVESKKQMVRLFIKERNIPKDMALRVTRFFHYVSLNEVRAEEKQIVQQLPPKLRSRVLNYMYEDLIQKVPAFQGQHPDLLAMIVSHLRLEYYMKGDIVTCQGDPPQGMYFIGEGLFEVRSYEVHDTQDAALLLAATSEDDLADWPWQLQGHMTSPGFWGHTTADLGLPAPATIVAKGFAELFLLPAEDLEAVLERFPEMHDVLQPYRLSDDAQRGLAKKLQSMKRGTAPLDEQVLIQSEYPFLASPAAERAEHKTAFGRLTSILGLTALTRHSPASSGATPGAGGGLARPSVFGGSGPATGLARPSFAPTGLARPSFAPTGLARPSTQPLGRASGAPLARPSAGQAGLDRRSLASLRRKSILASAHSGGGGGAAPGGARDRERELNRMSFGLGPLSRNSTSISREGSFHEERKPGGGGIIAEAAARASMDVEMGRLQQQQQQQQDYPGVAPTVAFGDSGQQAGRLNGSLPPADYGNFGAMAMGVAVAAPSPKSVGFKLDLIEPEPPSGIAEPSAVSPSSDPEPQPRERGGIGATAGPSRLSRRSHAREGGHEEEATDAAGEAGVPQGTPLQVSWAAAAAAAVESSGGSSASRRGRSHGSGGAGRGRRGCSARASAGRSAAQRTKAHRAPRPQAAADSAPAAPGTSSSSSSSSSSSGR